MKLKSAFENVHVVVLTAFRGHLKLKSPITLFLSLELGQTVSHFP